MSSGGRIVKQLLAKNGPMTTQGLFTYVPNHQAELISKTHLKQKILKSLEGQGVLYKQVKREPNQKPVWEWQFRDPKDIEKYTQL